MATFNNLSELNAHLGKIVEQEIVKFAEEVKKALQQELKAKFYGRAGYHQNSSGTDWYTRTWELVDCIVCSPVKKNGNEYSIKVYYNTDQMKTYDPHPKWTGHKSITDGEDARYMLPFWIEEGQDSPLYSWGGFHIVKDLTDRLIDDRALLLHFAYKFEQKGFKCVY